MVSRYIITNIVPNDCELKDVHKRWIGCTCEMVELERNIPMQLANWEYKDWPFPNILRTSNVTDIVLKENGDLIVHTRNTVYHLQLVVE